MTRSTDIPDLASYATIIVAFSGGKDSVACVLHLLELGVPRERIELWHHDVDGREGSTLMDWPVTRAYCRAFAGALGLPIYFSWKVGGFEREMLRDSERTQPICWENPDGTVSQEGGKRGKLTTRRKFPQVSADLTVRWCSAYLKIDVCRRAINGQARFINARTLLVSGERAAESSARAKYAEFEPDACDTREAKEVRRHVDRWRPVHAWSERDVWQIIARWQIAPHPAYLVGFGRTSCMFCIFGGPDQFATGRALDHARFGKIAGYEAAFGVTIKRKQALPVIADAGNPYPYTSEHAAMALSASYDHPIIVDRWRLPLGAFGDQQGPT